jgi:hypothetical protein
VARLPQNRFSARHPLLPTAPPPLRLLSRLTPQYSYKINDLDDMIGTD